MVEMSLWEMSLAEFASATYVPAGRSDLVIDWMKQRTTASGGEFIPSSITQLRIGMYDQSLAELETDFLRRMPEPGALVPHRAEALPGEPVVSGRRVA